MRAILKKMSAPYLPQKNVDRCVVEKWVNYESLAKGYPSLAIIACGWILVEYR